MKVRILILLLLVFFSASAQQRRGDIRIMFYNCENFFDVYDDPDKWDDQFTPEGEKHWTIWKYKTKVNHIAKVITAVGGWEPPEIVGLCEVENRQVLEDLVKRSALKAFKYGIIHFESPDRRGIDVALLYQPGKFKPDRYYPVRVVFPQELGGKPTRDILYVRGTVENGDTLHVFVNHWPSRFGGHMATDPLRMYVAQLVRRQVDSIFSTDPRANIVIIGDLNDFPTDVSLLEGLKTRVSFDTIVPDDLYNLSYYLQEVKGKFSHRQQGEGGILDQIIVSGTLLDKKGGLFTTPDDAHVYDTNPFLLEKDPNYPGYRPFRTYIGFKYIGGYSDHLPVYLDIFYVKRGF